MATLPRPSGRKDFHIAVICASPLEADAMALLFDEIWNDGTNLYGRAPGDMNTYITGRIKFRDVVLTTIYSTETITTTEAAASMRLSYNSLQIVILVGICGGVPKLDDRDVFLGDVIISRNIMQYDEDFCAKTAIMDSLGRATTNARGVFTFMMTGLGRRGLMIKARMHLQTLQNKVRGEGDWPDYSHPPSMEDRLFEAHYIHRRHNFFYCNGKPCILFGRDTQGTCSVMGCDQTFLAPRKPRQEGEKGYEPAIFIGCVGSGNTVIKSGIGRDTISAMYNLDAFEVEDVGAWDEVPYIMVKGICDYADSHQNKVWQNFAVATAASVARAVIERIYVVYDSPTRALTRK